MAVAVARSLFVLSLLVSSCQAGFQTCRDVNATFENPVFPGWHADPSCVFVPEEDNTTFCVTSSFLNFPGLPIYASKDLQLWDHVSNVLNRGEQLPGHASVNGNPRGGVWAPTIRYREGKFYVIVTYVTYNPRETARNYLFEADDPFSDASWSIPHTITNPGGGNHIDPDLFWDNGTAYMATGWGKIFLSVIDVETGNASQKVEIWKGSGGNNPEGPHFYKKDGYFYLLVAEGGAGINHAATVARSKDIYGPYESYEGNPVLTNRGSNELFQSVGHADLFPDANGNWWAVALTTRSGPDMKNYPMGRETALTAVTWEADSWPVFDPVRGTMKGPLPKSSEPLGKGPPIDSADKLDFEPGSSLPRYLVHFRSKIEGTYTVSESNSLRLRPSQSNLTGTVDGFNPADGVTFIGRRQTATLFEFSADLSFDPTEVGEEAGITVFLSQQQHIDLSVVKLQDSESSQLRMTATTFGRPTPPIPETVLEPIPQDWAECPIRLAVKASDPDNYEFFASSACGAGNITMGTASSDATSGGFIGTLIGIFATTDNGTGSQESSWSRWRYNPIAQEVDDDEYVPA